MKRSTSFIIFLKIDCCSYVPTSAKLKKHLSFLLKKISKNICITHYI